MANMTMPRHEMPAQEPDVRNKNFNEVALGYTKEMAMEEATRCLGCPKMPCKNGCPVQINIPDFIQKVAEGEFEEAYQIINKTSSLPAVCGRVCPQENQCEKYCVRGVKGEPVAIGRLERFVADWHNANATQPPKKPETNGHKVAIIGSGPAGLTCAGDLAKMGYEVTVFEALHKAGGVLVYGIPEFRLPKAIVQKEVDTLKQLGVEVCTNVVIGKTITIDELMGEMGFEAVFIGSGAGLPKFMNIPGENLQGVYSANEFLTRINLMKAYQEASTTPIKHSLKVAVVGGGNVAMDAARCAKRLGAEVHIVYRRSMEELPARHEEVEHAEEEGIIFDTLCNPVEILGYHNAEDKRDPKNGSVAGIIFDTLCNPVEILGYHNAEDKRDPKNGSVAGIRCIRMELGEPDEKGRRRPVEVPGSEFDMEMDCVIMALGTNPNPLIKATTKGLEVNKHGGIIVDENALTSREGVYAGGDAVTGAATVILAMGAGKQAAAAIDEYLKNK